MQKKNTTKKHALSTASQRARLSVGQLWDLCIKDPQNTVLVVAGGEAWEEHEGAGIRGGDIMIINTQSKPRKGSVAVVREDGELYVRVMDAPVRHLHLVGSKPPKPPEFEVYGVVERIIRQITIN